MSESKQKKFRNPACPYCGKTVGPLAAWNLRREGEYRCPGCGGHSNIVIDRAAYLLAVCAILAGFAVMAVFVLLAKNIGIWAFVLTLLPFAAFYALSPFLVRLKKPVYRKYPHPTAPRAPHRPENEDTINQKQTIVLDDFSNL